MRHTTFAIDFHQSAIPLLCTILTLWLLGSTTSIASVEDLEATRIGWSSIKITETGFDFGGETFLARAPTDDGWLDWHLVDGQLTPSLSGHLHLTDVRDLCARMRMDYYVGGQLWTTKTGGHVCAPAYIRISLHTLGADDTWRWGLGSLPLSQGSHRTLRRW